MSSSPDEPQADGSLTSVEPQAARQPEGSAATGYAARYADRGVLGRGGTSIVRRMQDRELLRDVALKLLDRRFQRKERLRQRFVEEAQITGQLDHPNILPIHELRQADEGCYITMKLVQGDTLERVIDRAGDERLASDKLSELLQIFLKICEATAFAHSRGVIHRDLKPSNVMVGEFGQVYLMDWGVSRVLEDCEHPRRVRIDRPEDTVVDLPGTIVGTPQYMAPEQVSGRHELADERTDIFQLGGILYHILTGSPPYTEPKVNLLLIEALEAKVPPPEQIADDPRLPSALAQVAMRALARDPDKRYPSVGELQQDVDRFLRGAWNLPSRRYSAGETLVVEGEPGEEAFLIVRGSCRVVDRSGQVLRHMAPGDVFGETAVIAGSRRTATVIADGAVEVLIVHREALAAGLGLGSWIGRFAQALAERFREADERLRQLQREQGS